MDAMFPFVRDQILPSWWTNAIQRFLTGLTGDFEVELGPASPTVTSVRVAIPTGQPGVVLPIQGRWRYIEAPIQVSHPGGAAGWYYIWAISGENKIVNTPAAGTDITNYGFSLTFMPPGGPTPPPVVEGVSEIRRYVAAAYWDGSQIKDVANLIGAAAREWQLRSELKAETQARGTAIAAETTARQAAIAAETSARTTALNNLAASHTSALNAGLNAEASARASAIASEASSRGAAISGLSTTLTAAINAEIAARQNGDAQLLNRFRWGLVENNGTVLGGSGGFTVTNQGNYRTLTMTGGWPGSNPMVAVANVAAASLADLAKARNATPNTVDIWTQDEAGSPIITAFTFIAIAT